jgi:hypothetical protein
MPKGMVSRGLKLSEITQLRALFMQGSFRCDGFDPGLGTAETSVYVQLDIENDGWRTGSASRFKFDSDFGASLDQNSAIFEPSGYSVTLNPGQTASEKKEDTPGLGTPQWRRGDGSRFDLPVSAAGEGTLSLTVGANGRREFDVFVHPALWNTVIEVPEVNTYAPIMRLLNDGGSILHRLPTRPFSYIGAGARAGQEALVCQNNLISGRSPLTGREYELGEVIGFARSAGKLNDRYLATATFSLTTDDAELLSMDAFPGPGGFGPVYLAITAQDDGSGRVEIRYNQPSFLGNDPVKVAEYDDGRTVVDTAMPAANIFGAAYQNVPTDGGGGGVEELDVWYFSSPSDQEPIKVDTDDAPTTDYPVKLTRQVRPTPLVLLPAEGEVYLANDNVQQTVSLFDDTSKKAYVVQPDNFTDRKQDEGWWIGAEDGLYRADGGNGASTTQKQSYGEPVRDVDVDLTGRRLSVLADKVYVYDIAADLSLTERLSFQPSRPLSEVVLPGTAGIISETYDANKGF